MDLAGLCAELVDDLDEVTGSADGEVMVYRRAGVAFARVLGSALEVRLPPDIGAAASRTPGTATAGEPGWIRFTPSDGEPVTDRAEAWFCTAWRHAGEK